MGLVAVSHRLKNKLLSLSKEKNLTDSVVHVPNKIFI